MRFDSPELAGTMSEIVAYGTAVVIVAERRDRADRAAAGAGVTLPTSSADGSHGRRRGLVGGSACS